MVKLGRPQEHSREWSSFLMGCGMRSASICEWPSLTNHIELDHSRECSRFFMGEQVQAFANNRTFGVPRIRRKIGNFLMAELDHLQLVELLWERPPTSFANSNRNHRVFRLSRRPIFPSWAAPPQGQTGPVLELRIKHSFVFDSQFQYRPRLPL